ncbi:DUF2946 domain-containing protein [Undibacterium sp. 5I1]|uniref:DUF2946 domain-containing protein n=1 Tax=unclassified Undibacterium TaxID=2630295 RepID=UPI002AB48153|nr:MULTISPECIES: DUF2946 domain-containing protein [unclassified Undibacterium]MDY7540016.1 DUF2946 domain-containing protein [Undibacterium sp. 5I1]MEB0232478.1 DUF2946 domain-containing protein [Undibacterium sp. 10I3]MEB0257863.1 DUF2946 domain-containing protein [Undibacterium sp. 5I1]
MITWLKRSRLPLWIALFAVLLNALAPSISHAIAANNGSSDFIEICTVSGTQFVKLDRIKSSAASLNTSSAPVKTQLSDHCPFCIAHAGSFALLPTSQVVPLVIDGHDQFPALFYHSPSPLISWSTANPRAPPLLS